MTKHIKELMPQALERHGVIAATVNFDGACEPKNPGGVATAGWCIAFRGQELWRDARFVCEGDGATNNVAEYHALGHALRWCDDNLPMLKARGINSLIVCGDSKLVIEQTIGRWSCNKEHLARLRERCKRLIESVERAGVSVNLQWVPREENVRADALSREAYEKHTLEKFPTRRQYANQT